MIESKNPVMKEETFTQYRDATVAGEAMTVNGTIAKTGILLALLVLFAVPGWVFASLPLLVVSGLIALVLLFAASGLLIAGH